MALEGKLNSLKKVESDPSKGPKLQRLRVFNHWQLVGLLEEEGLDTVSLSISEDKQDSTESANYAKIETRRQADGTVTLERSLLRQQALKKPKLIITDEEDEEFTFQNSPKA